MGTHQCVIRVAIGIKAGKVFIEIVVYIDWAITIILVYDGSAKTIKAGDSVFQVFGQVQVQT